MECQTKINLARCNCSYPGCPRRGKCCECITYHLESEELPACVFPNSVERTYDRSFNRFVEVVRSGKKS